MSLKNKYTKEVRIGGRSKKWWTLELGKQLKVVRECARGGKGKEAREHDNLQWKRWKNERRKLSNMIKKSKEEMWKKFLEENGSRNPWDIMNIAKNPWGRQGNVIKNLSDDKGRIWKENKEKVEIIAKRNFGMDPVIKPVCEEVCQGEIEGEKINELVTKIK